MDKRKDGHKQVELYLRQTQCSSCGGVCGRDGCKRKNIYPYNYAAYDMENAEIRLRESVAKGLLKGKNAELALIDADILYSMRLKWNYGAD